MGDNEVREPEVAETNDEEDDCSSDDEVEVVKPQKKRKPGIIYLSSIPKGFNVLLVREWFDRHGKVKRIFLQAADLKKKKKPGFSKEKTHDRTYTEGWVEFESKRSAKLVAQELNNTQVGGKRRSCASYSHIWNIKYLPRFKWVHLNERLTYEKATRRQRLRAEISEAKKEAQNFSNNLDTSERMAKWMKKNGADKEAETDGETFPTQRKMEPEGQKKGGVKKKAGKRKEFLASLFGKT